MMARIIELENQVDRMELRVVKLEATVLVQESLLQNVVTKVLGKENAKQESETKKRRATGKK